MGGVVKEKLKVLLLKVEINASFPFVKYMNAMISSKYPLPKAVDECQNFY